MRPGAGGRRGAGATRAADRLPTRILDGQGARGRRDGHRPRGVPPSRARLLAGARARSRARDRLRPSPLPRVGEQLRRARRRAGLVVVGKAAAAGATAGPEGGPDVSLPGGSPAWVDGGPRWSVPELGEPIVHRGVGRGRHPRPGAARAGRSRRRPGPRPARRGRPRRRPRAGDRARRVRARPACSPSACATCSPIGATAREAVIAVAYNKLAQNELETRLAGLEPRTRTLNSLGYSLLAEHRGQRARPFSTSPTCGAIDRRGLPDPAPAAGQHRPGRPLPRRADRGPSRPRRSRPRSRQTRDDVPGLAEGFDAYRERLAASGAIDFDEQIYGSIEALLRDGGFRRRMQAGTATCWSTSSRT